MKEYISFIDFTNMSDEEKYKLLNSKDYEIERLNNIINELENSKLRNQLQQKENIIKEVRKEVRIYEEQSNDGTSNELDNYVFVQRLKKVLDKEVIPNESMEI